MGQGFRRVWKYTDLRSMPQMAVCTPCSKMVPAMLGQCIGSPLKESAMKNVLTVLAILFATVLLMAQVGQSWNGTETQQLLAACVTHNADSVVCVATDGISFSYQGAAFVKVGGIGATGPAGPTGANGLN